PPSSTLFPYTTLFRSLKYLQHHHHNRAGRQGALEVHLSGLFRRDRFSGRASARAAFQRRHGAYLPTDARPVPLAERDQPLLLLRSEEHTSELQSPYDL